MPRPPRPTARLKCNPPRGQLPVLQYCPPDQLAIDPAYQRGLEAPASQALIRRIAADWDWGLCQPLFVARREDGRLFVVDGQHRLAAARLRGDIWQLPCVVSAFADPATEAAAFVALNQQRRPLNRLQLFKAALAAGDPAARTILAALEAAGLRLASSTNLGESGHGAMSNVGGLKACLTAHGEAVLRVALEAVAEAFAGQVLRYAGTLFPGVAAIVANEMAADRRFRDGELFTLLVEMVAGASQEEWARDCTLAHAEGHGKNRSAAAQHAFRTAWRECRAEALEEAA